MLSHRRFSSVAAESALKPDNLSTSTSKAVGSSAKTNETPLDVTPSYYAQGYSLMGFHHNNPFQSVVANGLGQEKENAALTSSTQTRSEGTVSKNNTSAATAVIETKKSESPEEPPNTQRKSVHPEFFMEEQVVPPSPTNKCRQKQHQQQHHQQTLKEQPKLQQQQQQQQSQHHEDYDNPNHLYAEINVKHRPQPMTRQGSEGTASLAMTSISSITGHGSLFTKDYDTGGLSPLPGGLWRIGSTVINTASEENYFDYSNDDTLREHRGENTGLLERIGNAVTQIFYTTCQCFEVNNVKVPMSPGVVKRESSTSVMMESKTLNEATVNTEKSGGGEPIFSSPMENWCVGGLG